MQELRYRECARHRWTYRRHRGNAGARVLTHKRVPPARATNPKTGGRDPSTSGRQPKNWTGQLYFLTLSVSSSPAVYSNYNVSELSGLHPRMSWPRSVRAAYLRRVRGRGAVLTVVSALFRFLLSLRLGGVSWHLGLSCVFPSVGPSCVARLVVVFQGLSFIDALIPCRNALAFRSPRIPRLFFSERHGAWRLHP